MYIPTTDLDDTLVPTTAADRGALALVEEEMRKRFGFKDLKFHVVLGAFRDSLRVSPWDPEGKVRE